VDSQVCTTPIRGSFTCRRSLSASPNAPVVNVHDRGAFLDLNRGNRTRGPDRVPLRESDQFPGSDIKTGG